jgi:hypothetical protein
LETTWHPEPEAITAVRTDFVHPDACAPYGKAAFIPRDGAIIFRDLVGKLDVLNIECDKCGRRGRYHLHRLIERYGIDANFFDGSDEIMADCPRKQARNLNDQCGARCPDLPKVV